MYRHIYSILQLVFNKSLLKIDLTWYNNYNILLVFISQSILRSFISLLRNHLVCGNVYLVDITAIEKVCTRKQVFNDM